MLRKKRKTTILITGASGFIGKYLIDALKDKYDIIALARRSSTEAGVPFHPNIRWIQWNIANKISFNEVMGYLIGRGGADVVVHLAGYYDYEYDDNPEYERTNVRGTKNVLELARQLDVKHFIFASSLAACNFPPRGKEVDEASPTDAKFTYAVSKNAGEDLCNQYSKHFKCSVVRFAAIFSDWCEYGPLYQFIQTWVSGKWDSKILGGKGESAITYLHILDLVKLFNVLIEKTNKVEPYTTYIASPSGFTTHNELFETVTRDFYGQSVNPMFIPTLLAYPGLVVKKILGRLHLVSTPFEKFWMLKYVDMQLSVNADQTMKTLKWKPTPRYHILRRMIYLLVKMKSHPNEWLLKNEAATKRKTFRPNLVIYEFLIEHETELTNQIIDTFNQEENVVLFPSYRSMDIKEFKIAISTLYNLLLGSVRSADRILMQNYIDEIAVKRFQQGFSVQEVSMALEQFRDIIMNHLNKSKELKNFKQEVYDFVGLTMQLAIDEVEDVYHNLGLKETAEKVKPLSDKQEKKRAEEIKQLSEIYQEYKGD